MQLNVKSTVDYACKRQVIFTVVVLLTCTVMKSKQSSLPRQQPPILLLHQGAMSSLILPADSQRLMPDTIQFLAPQVRFFSLLTPQPNPHQIKPASLSPHKWHNMFSWPAWLNSGDEAAPQGESETKCNRKGEILLFSPECWRHSRTLLPYLTEAGVWIKGWVTLAGLGLTPFLPKTWVMQSHVLEQRKQHTRQQARFEWWALQACTCWLFLFKW